MEFKRIDHVALDVSDLDRSTAFYAEAFGFVQYAENKNSAGAGINYMRLGDTILELVHRPAAMQGFHFCVETDDFDAAIARMTELDLPVVTKPHPTAAREPREDGWRRAVFAGPDGEHIEIRG